MTNETLRVLKERRSIRKFRPEQIKPEELDAILEAGTWAPTGMGAQSPVMVVVQDPEAIAYLSRMNAQIMGNPGSDPFYGAPTVVVVLADGGRPTWLQDGSLVMGNLMNAAASLGVGSCWINQPYYLDQDAELRALLAPLGLSDEECICCSLALGLPDGPLFPGRKEHTGNGVVWSGTAGN